MNARQAREIEKDHLNHAQKLATGECFNYRCGTAAGYLSAVKDERKRTEPVVENNLALRKLVSRYSQLITEWGCGCHGIFTCEKHKEIDAALSSSSAEVLEKYKREVLGEARS